MPFTSARRIILCLLVLATPAWAQRKTEMHQGREVVAGQVLVKFNTVPLPTIQAAQWLEDVDTFERVGAEGVVRMHSRSKDTGSILRDLAWRTDVVYAEPDYIVHSTATPTDARYAELWALKNTGQSILGTAGKAGADIGAEAAWSVTTGTRNVVVGVIDTGMDYNHPDLAANVWSNPTGIGGCPAGTHGYNAIAKTCDPMDDNFHGTHVSGTIGAVGNNGRGVVGVNWTTSLMALKFLDSSGSGSVSDAIAAIEFAIQAKIAGVNVRVLSNSWGGSGFSQALSDEIAKANTYDILFVVAAGNASANNDVTPTYPASFNLPNLISVAATDNQDLSASFSDYGPTSVHLGAPGVNILSTQPGDRYQYLSGTSMATPHVSGAAALILSTSSLTTAQLKSTLLNSVDPIPSLAGRTITGGRLNVCKAIPGCIVAPPFDFSLAVSPSAVTVPAAGGTATYSVTVARTGTGTGTGTPTLNLSVTGLPAGVTAAFNPNSTTGTTSALTLTVSSSTAAGTYGLTVTATGGSTAVTHTAAVTLVKDAVSTPVVTWTKVAMEGDTVFLPAGTTYRFGIDTRYLASVRTTAGWTVYVFYTNLGGDPAPGVRKELDVAGDGAGVIVNGVPFSSAPLPPPTTSWTKVAMEGDTVFLPRGTTYRFGIDTRFLAPVTITADWTVLVYYTNFGGDPAPGVVKELDVEGNGAGIIVNGAPFNGTPAPPAMVRWTKVAVEGHTVFLPRGTTYRFGIDTRFLAQATTAADWTVYVFYTNFGGDPAPGVVKELDVLGDGTGIIVDGAPFR